VVEEHPEETVEVEVDRARLDAGVIDRINDDASGGQLFPDRVVGQDHLAQTSCGL
jgi:hypothetical protein